MSDLPPNNPLPETGRFSVESWAAILGYEADTLRKKLRSDGYRVLEFGSKMFIDAEWYWRDLEAKQKVTTLPPNIYPGVIPPDVVQLSLKHWLAVLELTEDDSAALLKQWQRDGLPLKRFCGQVFMDATHVRKSVAGGKETDE